MLTLAVTLLWGSNGIVFKPSADRRDPILGGTKHPDTWAMHMG